MWLGVWRTPFLGPLVKTILIQASANQNCTPKVWGPSFLVMTHAFVSPLNLAPIFFNSSLKWKVGPVEIVSAERFFFFRLFFSIFLVEKRRHVTSPKNNRKDQWFRYRLTWGATWKTGPFRWELPRGRKFIGKWEIFHVELPAVKVLVLVFSVANLDIDFSELTSDVFRFFRSGVFSKITLGTVWSHTPMFYIILWTKSSNMRHATRVPTFCPTKASSTRRKNGDTYVDLNTPPEPRN